MRFSLIMATLGRFDEIRIFLDSIDLQNYTDFELIIVDQNEENILGDIILPYKKKFYINHIRIKEKGLSLARNVGIKYAKGDIIAFPDDDCIYSLGILDFVNKFFIENKNVDFLTFRLRDKETGDDANLRWYNRDVEITSKNIFRTVISPSIFIRVKNINDVFFDENLGVGRRYGSGEESDMVLELLYRGYKGMFLNNFIIYHPNKKDSINKIYSYGLGYAFGGHELAIKTLNKNYGLNIKDYITINFYNVQKIIDLIGGVPIDIKSKEIPYLNKCIQEISHIQSKEPTYITNEGLQTLNGIQTLSYARIRKIGRDDYERNERQQKILMALYEKAKSIPYNDYFKFINIASELIETNITTTKAISLAKNIIFNKINNIEQMRFPLDGDCNGELINNIWYLKYNKEKTQDIMQKYIFEDIHPYGDSQKSNCK
ncbi:Putative transcriptional attenuator domain protein [Candidatus Arthromitus sp. SFB-5]|nr:Putative transcriptional attenuator domain protein [Candidatus Arthromitus sp. SFB-5]